ncbi:MAG: TonB-dependent receptor [Gemmatimonadaceae bacterium]|nr:TonB-dependent receptor [Gemmatimonadaceae bacterium]
MGSSDSTRRCVLAWALVLGATTAAAQDGSATRLDSVRVRVSRDPATTLRTPWAVGLVTRDRVQGTQPTVGIDEALPAIPGVMVTNRYNAAQDQRLSIRGAGSRANFGVRGVKVFLDGIPQSLPDGQSQLTNIDLASIASVEVLRGAASSLYGNGSGGVLSFTTDLRSVGRAEGSSRVVAGSYGLLKTQGRVAARADRAGGAASWSRTVTEGFRQWSAARTQQANAAVDVAVRAGVTAQLRGAWAHTPEAENPGALTLAEYAANPDSAAAVNLRRGASRAVRQSQLSVRVVGANARDREGSVALYALARDVDNPLAVSPPGAFVANVGTLSRLGRTVLGARAEGARGVGAQVRLRAGVEIDHASDRRRNWRATAGTISARTDTMLVHQEERTTSAGAFLGATRAFGGALTASAGVRADQVTFALRDRFVRDGGDDSGTRTLGALTWNSGVAWTRDARIAPYANAATAFETPTTTELAARPEGRGGFNASLRAQRTRSGELGLRGAGASWRYEVATFLISGRDALVPYQALDGRVFYQNAGATRSTGVELGGAWRVHPTVTIEGAATLSRYRFTQYRVVRGAVTDTLDGRAWAGIPPRYARWSATWARGGRSLALDHTAASALWADDRNTIRVAGWGRGQLNLRGGWRWSFASFALAPFGGINNLFDVRYVGAVTVNGAGGRVLEPAPRRTYFAGATFDGGPTR